MSEARDGAPAAAGRAQAPGFHRFRVGSFEAVALHDGTLVRDRPPGFVRNAGDDAVGEAFAQAGMARDKLTLTFTALAIETGSGTVLIDTGMGDAGPAGTGRLAANLAAAGIAAGDVGKVVISHFHGDHISGLARKDGTPAFPNAEILVPELEWAYWTDESRTAGAPEALKGNFALVRRIFDPIARRVRRYGWGEELLPGMRSVKASGHTPGMSAVEIASGGEGMMFVADITNNPLIFARHPEWQAMFDMDPLDATATRKQLLDRAAADKLRLFFFHAPFPATGYVVRTASGYEYLPALWTGT